MSGKKIKVDTLIVSDIHLGFHFSRALDLVRTLQTYDFDRLILNGDIFDDLNFNRLPLEHWRALSYLRELSQSREVIWVIGNHDGRADILSHLIGVQVHQKYIWWSGDKKFLAIHGHQFDRLMTENVILSHLAELTYNFIRRIESNNRSISAWIKRANRSWLRLSQEVARGAMRYARLRRADYVFCGHTHVAMIKKNKTGQYYNSGSWIEYPANLITIKAGQIKIVEVK